MTTDCSLLLSRTHYYCHVLRSRPHYYCASLGHVRSTTVASAGYLHDENAADSEVVARRDVRADVLPEVHQPQRARLRSRIVE